MTLERLGESVTFGECLLALLEADGWKIERRPAFGGGVLLLGESESGLSLMVRGDNIGMAAIAAFKAAVPKAA